MTGLDVLDGCFDPGEIRSLEAVGGKAGDITGVWELSIDKLPPSGFVRIYFFTSNGSDATNYISLASGNLMASFINPSEAGFLVKPDPNQLFFYWEGEFQFITGGKFEKRRFFVPLTRNEAQRRFQGLAVQSGRGRWLPVTLNFSY
jgi:hypothetical protein